MNQAAITLKRDREDKLGAKYAIAVLMGSVWAV